MRLFRPVWAGRHRAAASRCTFFKGKTLLPLLRVRAWGDVGAGAATLFVKRAFCLSPYPFTPFLNRAFHGADGGAEDWCMAGGPASFAGGRVRSFLCDVGLGAGGQGSPRGAWIARCGRGGPDLPLAQRGAEAGETCRRAKRGVRIAGRAHKQPACKLTT